MTVSQLAACLAVLAAVVAVWGAVEAYRARRAAERTFPWKGGEVTVTAPMSEAEYEALKTRWLKEHGNPHAAHHVTELKPHPTEEQQ